MSEREGLEFFSTQDLLLELMSRFDACVFGGFSVMQDNEAGTTTRWAGNPHVCVGLSQEISSDVLAQLRERAVDGLEADEDDDPDLEDEPSWN